MKLAMTGSAGFVGEAAARCAVSRGHDLVRIVRPGAHLRGQRDVAVDLRDVDGLSRIAAGVDAVLHCAASEDPAFLAVSEAAAEALIGGLPPGGRFAMQAGSLVFGDTGPKAKTFPAYRPPPPLAERARFERRILHPDRSDIGTRIVYGSLIYGGDGAAIPSAMIHVAMDHGTSLYFGEGRQVWSSAHVHDFGALLIDAVENDACNHCCLFAAGRAVQIKPVADIIGQVLGVPSRPVRSPEEAGLFGPFAAALAVDQHFSSEPARREFRWCPEISDDGGAIVRALTRHAARTNL